MPFILKRVLPFTMALFVGSALANFAGVFRQHDGDPIRGSAAETSTVLDRRLVPEVYVLSPLTKEENGWLAENGALSGFKILSPKGARDVPAKIRNAKQGVVQLSVRFGGDGLIWEVTPSARRVDCGICLPRDKRVIEIDPNAPESRERIEAAIKAVENIRFIPFHNGDRYFSTHGLVECVFYQWE